MNCKHAVTFLVYLNSVQAILLSFKQEILHCTIWLGLASQWMRERESITKNMTQQCHTIASDRNEWGEKIHVKCYSIKLSIIGRDDFHRYISFYFFKIEIQLNRICCTVCTFVFMEILCTLRTVRVICLFSLCDMTVKCLCRVAKEHRIWYETKWTVTTRRCHIIVCPIICVLVCVRVAYNLHNEIFQLEHFYWTYVVIAVASFFRLFLCSSREKK